MSRTRRLPPASAPPGPGRAAGPRVCRPRRAAAIPLVVVLGRTHHTVGVRHASPIHTHRYPARAAVCRPRRAAATICHPERSRGVSPLPFIRRWTLSVPCSAFAVVVGRGVPRQLCLRFQTFRGSLHRSCFDSGHASAPWHRYGLRSSRPGTGAARAVAGGNPAWPDTPHRKGEACLARCT